MDHFFSADQWVNDWKKKEGEKGDDPTYCTIQSRNQLLYLLFFSGELITVAKGIRARLTVIVVLLVLAVLGIVAPYR